MKTYLGLADGQPIPEGYDKYLWISSECVDGIAWCREKGLAYEILPENRELEDLENDYGYLNRVFERLMEYLTPLLNSYSGVSYASKSWEMMITRQVNYLIDILYDKYCRLMYLRNRKISAECVLFDNTTVPFFDFSDFLDCFKSDEFQLYVYSVMIPEFSGLDGLKTKSIGEYKKSFPSLAINARENRKVAMFRIFTSALRGVTRREDKVVLIDPYLSLQYCFRLMLKHPGRITYYPYHYRDAERRLLECKIDIDWRLREEQYPSDLDEFATILFRIIKRFLPISCVENYLTVEKISKRLFKYARYPHAIFYSCSALCENEFIKSYMMRLKQAGDTKLFDVQHGNSGIFNKRWLYITEYRTCDRFYSWGWKELDKSFCEVKPMPMPKTIDIKANKQTKAQSKLLYIEYVYEKNYPALSCMQFHHEARENRIAFFEKLAPHIRNEIVFRAFPDKEYAALSIYGDLKKRFPNISADSERIFYKSIAKAALVVIPAFETTMLEALFFDRPFIVLLSSHLPVYKAAEQDVRLMKEIGVLVNTFEELRIKVEEVYPVVTQWWDDPARKKAILYLRNKYARHVEDPEKEWEEEICSYL